jgi:nucleoside-diphosphate-sugar epimerase
MLIYFLSQRKDVEKIYALDVAEPKFLWKPNEKIIFIRKNLVDNWENEIKNKIDVIFHLAFWIRRPFFNLKKHLYENQYGFEKVLNFCEQHKIKKIIIASSIAVYGAKKENNIKKLFKETDPLKEDIYLYGKEKINMEKQAEIFSKKNKNIKIIILRLATVTGPFGQKIFKKEGLLKILKAFPFFIILSSNNSLRQYVHEDDVISAFLFFLDKDIKSNFEIFNIAPSSFLYFKDIAKILKKKIIKIPFLILKIIFRLFWYLSFGKIPTSPGSENSYTFPIVVDNSKIISLGFQFKYSSLEAFLANKGYFNKFIFPIK